MFMSAARWSRAAGFSCGTGQLTANCLRRRAAAPEYISSYSMPVGSRRTVIFDYREGSFVYPSINVNSSFFPLAAEGRIAPDIILTIENFKLDSCFTEMSELKELLGEEIYSQVFYKLHIGENL